jgi:hypothetical protein
VNTTPRDLWAACDRLTNPTRERLTLDTGTIWIRLPSLWLQLHEAVESGAGQKTGSGGQQSKPPCDSAALSLLIEIATAVRDGCLAVRIKRTRDVPKDLRQIVSDVIRRDDPAALTTSHELIRSWVARVKVTISNDPDRTWPMRGACRVCSSTTVPVWEDGEELRAPALRVHSEHGVIDRVECSFCGSILDGDDLTALLYATLRRPELTDTTPVV